MTRVLCIEADVSLARLLEKHLIRAGYVVTTVHTGEKGLYQCEPDIYDVVIVNYRLPDMTGLDVLQHLAGTIPAILMTAAGSERLAVQAMKSGAADYISLDIDLKCLQQLPVMIEQALAEHSAARNLIAEQQRMIEDLDAFAHTVAHDLKNPLNVIIGTSEMLLDMMQDERPKMRQHQQTIRNIAYKMYSIVEELLLLAKLRRDEQEIATHVLDMDLIVDEVLARLSYSIHRSDARILRPQKWYVAEGYTAWIEEVWVNYISNAIKYGGEPPVVELGSELLNDGTIRFWVYDNGAGVPPDVVDDLFREFSQFSPDGRTEGHGLGLSIVRRIVEQLGGGVGVESSAGQGSTFWFTLPAAGYHKSVSNVEIDRSAAS
ncbi:MAG: hybrid sensor histidine kinase/response regulator [Chloroflexi bacterium]|nr:hybrid sensor histidine kinase/response regulator [Chloroflexota bacterium]